MKRQTGSSRPGSVQQGGSCPGSGEPSPRGVKAQSILAPGLYVTATPIGHARDITLRALDVLKASDVIAAEDTRVTGKLLAIYGISKPLIAYNDHNAARERPRLLERLREGQRVALVSDAGTPLVSDPGYKLVREAIAEGIRVEAIPGASALLAALVLAGLPTDRFFFAGFLPHRSGERRSALLKLKAVPASLVFFEAPQRLAESLADMTDVLGPREAAIGREMTKLHEEVVRDSLAVLASIFKHAEPPRGEVTVVIGPPQEEPADLARVDSLLEQALAFMPVRAASDLVAEAVGASRREVYGRALELKDRAHE